jgi:hypothetical protein
MLKRSSLWLYRHRPVSKMAAITQNRNFFKWPKLLYFKPESVKFELYKHNEELFNIYYGIFYELWTFAYFNRLCKSFQQSLVEIGSVVSEKKIFFKFHSPFFLICIIGQNRQKFKVHILIKDRI